MTTTKTLTRLALRQFTAATASWRTLPDFIVIGAQRSGTSSFYRLLTQHPSIARGTKEIHFFDVHFQRGTRWYRRYFPMQMRRRHHWNRHGTLLRAGEASPYYLFHPHAARRIMAVVPQARLIALLRDPVDRAYSHYWLNRAKGRETLSFEEALAQEEERLRGERERMLQDETYGSLRHRRFSYLARGRYAEQLRVWLEHVPRDQLLIIKSEEYFQAPSEVLERVFAFFGLPAWRLPHYGHRPSRRYEEMDARTRRRLSGYFAPHNRELAELLGVDMGWPSA